MTQRLDLTGNERAILITALRRLVDFGPLSPQIQALKANLERLEPQKPQPISDTAGTGQARSTAVNSEWWTRHKLAIGRGGQQVTHLPAFQSAVLSNGCRIVHHQHDHQGLMAERLGRSHRSTRNARTPATWGAGGAQCPTASNSETAAKSRLRRSAAARAKNCGGRPPICGDEPRRNRRSREKAGRLEFKISASVSSAGRVGGPRD